MASAQLQEIYREEMRSRIEKLRLSMALSGAIDPKARAGALYDAHLQAHTMKGTSEQLGYREAGSLAAAMSEVLEQARADDELPPDASANVERGCNAFITWLEGGQQAPRPLLIAAGAFARRAGGRS